MSMSKPIIEIKGIGKRYRIGANKEPYLSLREEIIKWFSPSARRAQAAQGEFWALKDVGFAVQEGEAIGVIGKNGAGKSTLLKVLSKITPPTEGNITMRGRVASLLEVGTGFHPELTGRENIYLNGAILGMSRGEISRKFDEIVAFAEVEKFLDTPVKRYSSGMYVRLAFAVAAHLEPEILIVDEVLSVGDAVFQAKCLGKMGDVAKGGRTVLFVSHNMAAVRQLCEKGILLTSGKMGYIGETETAILKYSRIGVNHTGIVELEAPSKDDNGDAIGKVLRVQLTNAQGEVCDTFFVGDRMSIHIDVMLYKPVKFAEVAFVVTSRTRGNIYHCVSRDANLRSTHLNGPARFTATFPCLSLYPGSYAVSELVLDSINETFDHLRDVVSFQVVEGGPHVNRLLSNQFALVHEVPEWKLAITANCELALP